MASVPIITVLMPVFNGEKYLRKAVDSVLSQTLRDFEFWIIDDNSTDTTAKILESYEDQRIRIFRNDVNIGLAASLNEYMGHIKSRYIARMDSDDISLPKRFEKQIRFMEDNPDIGICGTWIGVFGDKKSIIRYPEHNEQIRIDMLFSCPLAHPTIMIRKEIRDKLNILYRTDYAAAQDYELWTRISGSVSFANLQEVLLEYRVHKDQAGHSKKNEQASFAKSIRLERLKRLGIDPTGADIMIHESIASGKYERSAEFVQKASEWFDKLYDANLKSMEYDKEELAGFLGQKLFKICRKVTRANRKVYSLFSLSTFSAHVGALNKLGLRLRCLMGI